MFPKNPWAGVLRLAGLFLVALAGMGCLAQPGVHGEKGLCNQAIPGRYACGPCSVYNAMACGRAEFQAMAARLPGATPEERVMGLIKRHGGKPSAPYFGLSGVYAPDRGMLPFDCPEFAMDCLGEFGAYRLDWTVLARTENEPLKNQLRRVHADLRRALDSGFPPIADLQSYARHPGANGCDWERLMGHFVVIVGVQPALGDGAGSFTFQYADSLTGRFESGVVSVEEDRAFAAQSTVLKKFLRSDWLVGHPYPIVTGTSLRMDTDREPAGTPTVIVVRQILCVGEGVGFRKAGALGFQPRGLTSSSRWLSEAGGWAVIMPLKILCKHF